MYLSTKGLVLRVTDYNDRDALLTLLTPEHGKITAKARGLRRKNSPLTAPCQLLAYGDFTLFEYRGNFTVNEAASVELFRPLRSDLSKLALGTYFAQVAELVCQEDLPNPEVLSLTLNCLYALAKMDEVPEKVKAVFELRIACLAGYQPDLSSCRCGRSDIPALFDLNDGALECGLCRNTGNSSIRMPIDAGVLQAMRFIAYAEPKKIMQFTLTGNNYEVLSSVTESYLTTQLERGFSTLDFYKSLLI